jgi:hypothetical protein
MCVVDNFKSFMVVLFAMVVMHALFVYTCVSGGWARARVCVCVGTAIRDTLACSDGNVRRRVI